jgi:hypothetical protein
VVGIFMGFALIMVEVRSPMLFAVGMYLPIETTSAIFVGGIVRWVMDRMRDRRGLNEAQRARVENAGVLTASGFIAGEALMGLVYASFVFFDHPWPEIFRAPSYAAGIVVLLLLCALLVWIPLKNAGRPEDPAPPVAIMLARSRRSDCISGAEYLGTRS